MAYSRIRLRRGTAYEWSTINPLLEEGELALEYPDEGIGGLCKFKVGNGNDRWNDLGYAFDGTAASSIDGGSPVSFHTIKLRSGSSSDWANVDPVLVVNEIIYVTDKQGFKIGDGLSKWSELPYTKAGGFVDDMIDFGDEDEEETIYGGNRKAMYEAKVTEGLEYPDNIFDNGSVPTGASIDDFFPVEEVEVEGIDQDQRESESVKELEGLNK